MPTATKPVLYLLDPSFEDADYPGQRFFCRHGALVEGVLDNFPDVRAELDIRRVGFSRPRTAVIEAIGEINQGLPVLVLPPGETSRAITGSANGTAFAAGAEAILDTLAERHGLPLAHP